MVENGYQIQVFGTLAKKKIYSLYQQLKPSLKARKTGMQNSMDSRAEVQDTQIDLKGHLSKHNVPDTVYELLCRESITADELTTFTNEDLKDWCNEHSLKTIERRRLLNAVKSLLNAQANIEPEKTKIVQVEVPVFLGNEEKEQLNQFDEMKKNVTSMIHHINEMQIKINVDRVVQKINQVCDEIESFVKTLRRNLLQKVYICLCCLFCI